MANIDWPCILQLVLACAKGHVFSAAGDAGTLFQPKIVIDMLISVLLVVELVDTCPIGYLNATMLLMNDTGGILHSLSRNVWDNATTFVAFYKVIITFRKPSLPIKPRQHGNDNAQYNVIC